MVAVCPFALLPFVVFWLWGRPRFELAEEGSSAFADIADGAPWLKVWVRVWAIIIAAGSFYVIKHSIDLSSIGLFRVLLIPFTIVMVPFFILNERRRFIALGEIDGAT
ncbi:MAG: hypothetical protein LBI48_11810 [Burkholderiaceae bacterium]|nr:hypothetical protein [Burkholderiaceae bacterium]